MVPYEDFHPGPTAWDERDDEDYVVLIPASEDSVEIRAHIPEAGQDCPVCNRRVPLPKTDKTPPTKVKGYRIPTDEFDAHKDVLDEAAKFLGCAEQPYHEFKTITLALALVLQDDSLKGYANRRPQ